MISGDLMPVCKVAFNRNLCLCRCVRVSGGGIFVDSVFIIEDVGFFCVVGGVSETRARLSSWLSVGCLVNKSPWVGYFIVR